MGHREALAGLDGEPEGVVGGLAELGDGLGVLVALRDQHSGHGDAGLVDQPHDLVLGGEVEELVLLELGEHEHDAVAGELGLPADSVLIDYPSRTSMLGVDLPLLTRDGSVERLTDEGRVGQLGLPRIAGELYQSARRLRMFTRTPVEMQGIPMSISG